MSGELKHGPLAMVDANMRVIMIIMKDRLFERVLNALHEVHSRHGNPILITNEKPDSYLKELSKSIFEVPKTVDCLQSILAVVPLQLLSFHVARLKGLDVDCPRNLAKSVTVE
ncbi:hypothetical protein ACTXT7_015253 [Hymenolepis weldensis]